MSTKIVPIYAGSSVTEGSGDRFGQIVKKLGSIGTGGTFFFLGAFMASGAVMRFTDFEIVALTLAAWFTPGAASAFGAVSTAATVYGWSLILRKKNKINKKGEAKNEAQNQLANLMEFLGGFLSQGGAVASTVAAGAAITVTSMTYLPEENVFGIEKPPISIQRLKFSQLFEPTDVVAAIHEQEILEELAAAEAEAADDTGFEDEIGEEIEVAAANDIDEGSAVENEGEGEEELLVIDMTGESVRVIYKSQVFTDHAAIESLIENISAGKAVPAVVAVNVPKPPPSTHPAPIGVAHAPAPTGVVHAPAPTGVVHAPAPTGVAHAPAPIGVAYTPAPAGVAHAPAPTGVAHAPVPTGVAHVPAPTGVAHAPAPTGVAHAPAPTGVAHAPVPTVTTPLSTLHSQHSPNDTASTVVAYLPATVIMPPVTAAPALPDTAPPRSVYQPPEDEPQAKPAIPQTAEQAKSRGIIVSVRPEFLVIMGETSTAGVTAEAGMVNDNGFYLTADIAGGGNYFGGGVNVGYAFAPFGDAKSVIGLSGGYHNTTVVHNLKSEDGTLLAREHGNKIGAGGVFVKFLPFKSGNLDITNRVLLGKSNLHRYDENTNDFKSEEGLSAAYSIGVGYSIMKRGQ